MKNVSSALKNYIVDAVLLIVLGLVLVIWPHAALRAIFTWTGIGLIVLGVIKGIIFIAKKEDQNVTDLLVGLLQIAVGIFFIVRADFLIAFFPTVMALLLGYGAIVMIIRAIKLKNGDRNPFILALVLGIVTLILAVIIFLHPALLANIMMQASGVSMILEGISILIVLSRNVEEG